MYIIFSVLIILTSLFLILIVLVQNPKGGGLSSTFAGSNQVMGVRKTADFLEKATWTLAIALLVFSLSASMTIPKESDGQQESLLKEQVENAIDRNAIPVIPDENTTTTPPDDNGNSQLVPEENPESEE